MLGRALAWVLVLSLGLLTFAKHVTLCAFPYQVEPTEGGMLQSAKVMAEGGDPWAPAIAPESYNAYGWVYPWAAAQWHRLQPGLPWLLLLRLVTALGVLAALGVLWVLLREADVAALEAALLCAALYPVFLFPDSYSSRPDGLGLLFFLGALALAIHGGRRGAWLAGALAAAAFFCKSYFILAAPIAFIALWQTGRRRDALQLAATGLGVGLGLLAFTLWRYPHYLEGTLFQNGHNPEGAEWAYAGRQLYDLALRVHWPLTLALPLAGVWAWRTKRAWKPQGPALAWAWAVAAAALALLVSRMGGHTGAYLRYYNQLLLAPLYVALFLWLKQVGVGRPLLLALFLLCAGLTTSVFISWPRDINAKRLAEWARADAWVAAHPWGLYPPEFCSLSVAHDGLVTGTGHTHVLKHSQFRGQPTLLARAALRRDAWVTQELVRGRLQSVVCGEYWRCPPGLEAMGYKKVDELMMDPPVRYEVYVPRKAPPKPQAYVYVEEMP